MRFQIRLWHILVLAAVVRLAMYGTFNLWLFDGAIEHPDTHFYIEAAANIRDGWERDGLSIRRYPLYSNMTAALSYLPGPTRVWPELLNMVASVGVVGLLYGTIRHLTTSDAAPLVGAGIYAVEPYASYLSTQYLRDSLIIAGVAATMFALTSNRPVMAFVGSLVMAVLRPVQAYAIAPWLLLFWRRPFAVVTGLFAIGLVFMWDFAPSIANQPEITESTYSGQQALAASIVGPHREFFGPRERAISYVYALQNPLLYADIGLVTWALRDALLFPSPFEADTWVEGLFGLYMGGWYGVLLVAGLGWLTWPSMRFEGHVLFLAGLSLAVLLGMSVYNQAPFVRWRLGPYYMMMPALAVGVGVMMSYEGRKRAMDIVIALGSLIVLTPVWLAIMVTLRLTQRNVFFSQRRRGKDSRYFTIYKFATMVPGSDGVALGDNDPRLTRLGRILRKTALDEIPECWNILKGDMSVVGPRPLATWEDDRFEQEIPGWCQRYTVLPGLCGLAQLKTDRNQNGRKLDVDLEYIARRSHRLDLEIFLRNCANNLTGKWH